MPKVTTSLDACLRKVERAKDHRDSLDAYIRETFAVEANRPRLGIRSDPETADQILYINYMPELDAFIDRCSLILGDAVHNLISALDRLTYQLALSSTGGNIKRPNSVQFPICDTLDAFSAAKARYLREIDEDHIAIIERFQGYHRIDEATAIGPYFHPLCKLRDLASVDKHRLPIKLVVPTSGGTHQGIESLMILLTGVLGKAFSGGGFHEFPPAELGAEVMRSKFPVHPNKAQIEMAGYVSAVVALDGDYSTINLLDKIAAVVIKVIREFEPFFGGRPMDPGSSPG